MRSLIAIFSLLLLVSFQAADACCDHDSTNHAHLEAVSDAGTKQISDSNQHHQHDGPCGCACHQKIPADKTTFPAPRIEVEPVSMIEICNRYCSIDHFSPPTTGPPLTKKSSLPPSSAREICSQHCRFLL